MKLMILTCTLTLSCIFSHAATSTTELKVATYNVGYLYFVALGRVFAEVPDYQQRLSYLDQEMSRYLQEHQPDVIAFQEVWRADAQTAMRAIAEKNGYTHIAQQAQSERTISQHGLEFFVKNELSVQSAEFSEYLYRVRNSQVNIRWIVTGTAADVYRGALRVTIVKNGKSFEIFNTHLTPMALNHNLRRRQARSLTEMMNQSESEVKLVAADLNLSPQFEFSIEGRDQDGSMEQWSLNAETYSLFLAEADLTDTFVEIHGPSVPGYTQDRLNNDLADFSPSTAQEPEQRIDHIFVSSQSGCTTQSSELFFTEHVRSQNHVVMSETDPTQRLFLSDHFGVQSLLSCP